jgi:hypothetical protein
MITLIAVGTRYRPTWRSKVWYANQSTISSALAWAWRRSYHTVGDGSAHGVTALARYRERSIYTIDWSKY